MRAALLFALLLVASQAQAEGVVFDAFLAGAEKCGDAGPFYKFHRDIAEKYRNDFGGKVARVDPKVALRIPPDVTAGVGQPRPTNKGEHTEVIVPLDGTWRGVATKEIEFGLGNENGIHFWLFRFAAPRDAVVRAFGKDVAAGAQAFKRKAGDGVEFSVEITKDKAEIVCNQSD